jgi:hypothetical protein
MSKKRRVSLSESRRVDYVWQLQDWLAELPRSAPIQSISCFGMDGTMTISWEEDR